MSREFEQLYNAYYMQVYSYLVSLTKNQHTAEELTQKTFFKAFTTSSAHRGESSELTWLCAIAKNLYVDELREHKWFAREADVSVLDSGDGAGVGMNASTATAATGAGSAATADIETALVDSQSTFMIHKVLHELEEPYKEVFQLRVFGELPFLKIGLLFGKTENWARVTYHRARLKVQQRLEQQ
jgi:RNA polymerase sigma-70 factor (ECF subfamily)